MTATLTPVYPLVLHNGELWEPGPEIYFTRDFIVQLVDRARFDTTEEEPPVGWSLRGVFDVASDGAAAPVYAVFHKTAEHAAQIAADLEAAGQEPDLQNRVIGHYVWRLLTDSWTTHLGTGEQIVKGVWKD